MFGNKTKLTCVVCDKSIDDLELSAVTKTGERIHDWCISALKDEEWQAKKDAQDKLLSELHTTPAASLVDRKTLADKGYVQAEYAVGLATFTGHFTSNETIAGQEAPSHEALLKEAMERCIARLAEAGVKKGANALLNTKITPIYLTGKLHSVLIVSGTATAALVAGEKGEVQQEVSVQ